MKTRGERVREIERNCGKGEEGKVSSRREGELESVKQVQRKDKGGKLKRWRKT